MTTEPILSAELIADAFHEHDNLLDFARAIEQAVLQSDEVQAWKRMAEMLEEKIESYERYGPICEFEGEPMIHATHLEELRAAMEKQP